MSRNVSPCAIQMQIATVSFSQQVNLDVKHMQARISALHIHGFRTVNCIARRASSLWGTGHIKETLYRSAGVAEVGVKTRTHLRTITGRANPRLQTQTGEARVEASTDTVAGAVGTTGSMAHTRAVTGAPSHLI
jgi:hypothetical protein